MTHLSKCLRNLHTFQESFMDILNLSRIFALRFCSFVELCSCWTYQASRARMYLSLFLRCSSERSARVKQPLLDLTLAKRLKLPSRSLRLRILPRRSMRWTSLQKIRKRLTPRTSKVKSNFRMFGSDILVGPNNGSSKVSA